MDSSQCARPAPRPEPACRERALSWILASAAGNGNTPVGVYGAGKPSGPTRATRRRPHARCPCHGVTRHTRAMASNGAGRREQCRRSGPGRVHPDRPWPAPVRGTTAAIDAPGATAAAPVAPVVRASTTCSRHRGGDWRREKMALWLRYQAAPVKKVPPISPIPATKPMDMRQSDAGSEHHYDSIMPSYNAPLEIHVHGQVPLRADASFEQLQEALKPLWKYVGARSLTDGATSVYEEEPGIQFDAQEHLLQICWTVHGDEDFRQSLDEMCMSLNDRAEQGAAIEVTFYDAGFDEDDEEGESDADSRDEFILLFVGPTPAAIMQVQRDLLVQDVVDMMERHFDGAELGGVVAEIDKLFSQRFDALVNSLGIGKPPRGSGGSGSGQGGGRRPRHLH